MRSFANSSKFFWNLVQKKRVNFLFGSVFEKLAERFEVRKFHQLNASSNLYAYPQLPPKIKFVQTDSSTEDETSSSEDDEITNYGFLREKHKFKSIAITCLDVSALWKQEVQNCYQQPFMTGIKGYFEDIRPIHIIIPWAVYKIDCRNDEVEHVSRTVLRNDIDLKEKFLDFICIGRSLSLIMSDDTNIEYCLTLDRILAEIGHLIYYVRFNFYGNFGGKIETFQKLIGWLNLMPNLKVLEIAGGALGETLSDELFSQNPLPNLHQLEMIRFKYVNQTMVKPFLQNYTQISHLALKGMNDVEQEVLCSLTKLVTFISTGSLNDIRILKNTRWRLTKLSLIIDNLADAAVYFETFRDKWTDTLVDLNIKNDRESLFWEESKYLALRLQKIKRFSIYITSMFYLDFILPLKNTLEYLEIKFTHENPDNIAKAMDNQHIVFVGYEDQLQSSNLWEIFRKLKSVKVEFNPGYLKRQIRLYKRTPHGVTREEIVY